MSPGRVALGGLMTTLAVLAALAAAPGAAMSATRVESGALTARVERSPWALSFVNPKGRAVLSEHPGRSGGPSGSLGFEAGGAWRHATRVLSLRRSRGGVVVALATTDPAGRRIRVRLAPRGERRRRGSPPRCSGPGPT